MSGRRGTREGQREGSQSLFGEVISAYTREQAIADGVLIDVSETAKEAGIRYPTCLTRAVWNRYVEVPDNLPGQDREGRLWDILWMCRWGISRSKDSSELLFELHVANEPGPAKPVTLKAICGPGDKAEPVITICLPEED
jgi:hypothetical protein